MVSALDKKLGLLLFILILPVTFSVEWPIPLEGKIQLNADIQDLTLTQKETNMYSDTHDLLWNNQLVGQGIIEITIKDGFSSNYVEINDVKQKSLSMTLDGPQIFVEDSSFIMN